MKYFKALISIPKPKPPSKPVMNLSELLLIRYPINCVVPSSAAGINNSIARTSTRIL